MKSTELRFVKACPVVLRHAGAHVEVLAFEHPRAGLQLVKGTIEPGENAEAAALRELAEEAGIDRASVARTLGVWHSGFDGQVWHFSLVEPLKRLEDTWVHHAPDDGGLLLRFFWHPLRSAPGCAWHPLFQAALR